MHRYPGSPGYCLRVRLGCHQISKQHVWLPTSDIHLEEQVTLKKGPIKPFTYKAGEGIVSRQYAKDVCVWRFLCNFPLFWDGFYIDFEAKTWS